jgi:hypothetical protein
MLTYSQSTGDMFDDAGTLIGQGYSGIGEGLNNPAKQDVQGVGPLPQGSYTIGAPFDDPTTGPYSMRLEPAIGNNMFGRSAFLIHGDTISNDHTASHGCIVMARAFREKIWSDGDHALDVTA